MTGCSRASLFLSSLSFFLLFFLFLLPPSDLDAHTLTPAPPPPRSTFHRVRCPRPGENQHARFSLGFFNQARRDAVIQGPAKRYPPITGGEFLAQAMKVRPAPSLSSPSSSSLSLSREVD